MPPLPSTLKKEVPEIDIERENTFVPSLKIVFGAESTKVVSHLSGIPSLSRRESN